MLPVHVLANPGTPRWRAWESVSTDDLGVELRLVPWRSVLQDMSCLRAMPGWLRFDSFGLDDHVIRRLLEWGFRAAPSPEAERAVRRVYRFGEMHPPAQLSRGVTAMFTAVEAALGDATRVWTMPAAICTMFDKVATRQTLREGGILVPDGLDDLAPEVSIDERLEIARARGFTSLYIKSRSGSSACGLVWLHLDSPVPTGMTTVAQVGTAWCNTRRLRPLEWASLAPVVHYVHEQGATWESGVPLLEVDGDPCDVRMVVVAGRVRGSIGRAAPQPITNLHLGGRRVTEAQLTQRISAEAWSEAQQLAEEAVRVLGAHSAGVDVVFDRRTGRASILEVNAFGDFFPGWVDAAGEGFHRMMLRAMATQLV